VNLGSVLGFSDMMILCMAFPNIAGALLLSNKVRRALDAYWHRFGNVARPVSESRMTGDALPTPADSMAE
jgi:hypothetical protein